MTTPAVYEDTDIPQGHRTGNTKSVAFTYYSLGCVICVHSLLVYSSGLGNQKTCMFVM